MPEYEMMSVDKERKKADQPTDEEVLEQNIWLMVEKSDSEDFKNDVVVTSGGNTKTRDRKGNNQPYVRVWGVVGEVYLREALDRLLDELGEDWYKFDCDWFFPQVGVFINKDGVHWPPEGKDAVYRKLTPTT